MKNLSIKQLKLIRNLICVAGIVGGFILWTFLPNTFQNTSLFHVGNGESGFKVGALILLLIQFFAFLPDTNQEEIHTEDPEERAMFLGEIGLEESGVVRLIQSAYALLNLQTFFTAGADECRAWTIHKGDKAPQAAGVIHTDFEKGFIRAEVIKYDDFVTLRSEAACRAAGKLASEGKEYVVQDGDIMHFRFNV